MKKTPYMKAVYLTRYIAPAAALACVVVLGAWALMEPVPSADVAHDPVFSREIVAYEVLPAPRGGEPVVKYEYLGDELPEKLAPDEDVTKRTENSFHRVLQQETKDTPAVYEGVFYPQPTFTEEGNVWRYIEHATTTKAAFDALRAESPLAMLFLRKAQAQSISPFASVGDGWIVHPASTSEFGFNTCDPTTITWTNAREADTGTAVANTSSGSVQVFSEQSYDVEMNQTYCATTIVRAFFPFDTSSIPSGATISAATLNIYITGTTNTDNDGIDYLTIIRTSQSTHTTLADADYDNVGTTEGIDSGQRKDISSIGSNVYLSFTLNATGQGWISKSGQVSNCSASNGITCLGMREGHDNLDSSNNPNTENTVTFYTSERTGTSEDPYLTVTYSGGGTAFWMWSDF